MSVLKYPTNAYCNNCESAKAECSIGKNFHFGIKRQFFKIICHGFCNLCA